jgi:hypothetical protein
VALLCPQSGARAAPHATPRPDPVPHAGGTPSLASDSLACATRTTGGIRTRESDVPSVRILLGTVKGFPVLMFTLSGLANSSDCALVGNASGRPKRVPPLFIGHPHPGTYPGLQAYSRARHACSAATAQTRPRHSPGSSGHIPGGARLRSPPSNRTSRRCPARALGQPRPTPVAWAVEPLASALSDPCTAILRGPTTFSTARTASLLAWSRERGSVRLTFFISAAVDSMSVGPGAQSMWRACRVFHADFVVPRSMAHPAACLRATRHQPDFGTVRCSTPARHDRRHVADRDADAPAVRSAVHGPAS